MKIRFYNARILTMQDDTITEGVCHVVDGKITYLGNGVEPKDTWDREIDCKRNLLMPGFKNAHTHSGMTLMRTYADGLPLQEWLETKIFPLEAKMSPDDVALLSKLAILEYLTSGVTAVFDMYLTPESIADAFYEVGMRVVQVSGINKFGPTLEVLEERYNKLNGVNDLTSFMLGFHAEYTCDRELLEKISALASHRATMVIFLSASLTASLQEELLKGGYPETTPCAIVYKATWPEERILRGQLWELSRMAEENRIRKTALIVVGNVLGSDYELSRLYDKSFSTEYREVSV